jgi:ribonuclease BN (tRNA processing enzyme)
VRVRILSPFAPDAPQLLSSYLVNDELAIDAGCLGLFADPPPVRHVFLTHAHADHVLSLPMFLQGVPLEDDGRVHVYGSEPVLAVLRSDVFNGRLWPGYPLRAGPEGVATLEPLKPEKPIRVAGLTVTPVAVDHVVPTLGYLVDDGECSVVFGADSGPTARLWELARASGRCRAVFLETSFPDALAGLAETTGHLTPGLVREEVAKMPEGTAVITVHLAARHRDRIERELMALDLPGLTVGRPGHEYRF